MSSGHKEKFCGFRTARKTKRHKLDIPYPVKVIAREGEILAVPEIQVLTRADVLASTLRQSAPRSERLLWQKIEPMGFKHSAPVIGYVADFYHPVARICVEVDGGVHRYRVRADRRRNRALGKAGIRTYRFSAASVYADVDRVAMHIKNLLTLATPVDVASLKHS